MLIGSAVGGGLVIGFLAWPRRYLPNLSAAKDEHIFNAFLKIGSDNHIVVVVPQVELGQGVTTLLPQIVADELGADWRSVGVEPAPINGIYAHNLFAEAHGWRTMFGLMENAPLQITDEGLMLSVCAEPMRLAAAGARMALCAVAARQWGVPSESCETAGGLVIQGKHRAYFGALAAAAAKLPLPEQITLRQGAANRLIGTSLPRLDAPAKVDGSLNFAADVRLPEMVFATVRQAALGVAALGKFNEAAARKVRAAIEVVALPSGLACVGETSWVASQMLNAAAPQFTPTSPLVDDATVHHALDTALKTSGTRVLALGDADAALAAGQAESATYKIGLLPHAALEPMAATARYDKGLLEIWTSAQAPDLARSRAATATGLSTAKIIIHSVMGGGSFGRRLELEMIDQVAALALQLKRPVQLFWERAEDLAQERFGGGATASLTAQALPDGRINAWRTSIAAAPTATQLRARLVQGQSADAALRASAGVTDTALLNAIQPPYVIPHFAIDTYPLDLGVPTGPMRGDPDFATCFFNECFINELSAKSGVEPFSFRMALIGNNTRLAQCLAKVSALAGWSGGGVGSNQGLACYTTTSVAIAVIAEAKMDETGRVRVTKLSAVADLGQLVNPDIARQHIEGGLLFGMGLAVGAPVRITKGRVTPLRLGELGLPRLADVPEINIDLIASSAPAADAWDCAVPPVAPAIAGALFAGSGKRFRTLPFTLGA